MKKVISVAIAMVLCLGLLAACGSNPKHDEVKTLMAEARAEYEDLMQMLEESEAEGVAQAKSYLATIESQLQTIEAVIESDLKRASEEELDSIIESIKLLKQVFADAKEQFKDIL